MTSNAITVSHLAKYYKSGPETICVLRDVSC